MPNIKSLTDNIEQINNGQSLKLEEKKDSSPPPIWKVIVELGEQIPDEEWAKVPPDASMNYKQYLYGTNRETL